MDHLETIPLVPEAGIGSPERIKALCDRKWNLPSLREQATRHLPMAERDRIWLEKQQIAALLELENCFFILRQVAVLPAYRLLIEAIAREGEARWVQAHAEEGDEEHG